MRLIVARVLLLGGIGLLAWTAALLGWRRWLDLDDAAPAPESPRLVFAGPFAVIRHPQTLALLMLLGSVTAGWPRPGLAVVALIAGTVVLALAAADEPRLIKRFGEAYRRYQRSVPFLVPPWW